MPNAYTAAQPISAHDGKIAALNKIDFSSPHELAQVYDEINLDTIETWERLTDIAMLTQVLSDRDEIIRAQNEAKLLGKARDFKRVNDFKQILKAVKQDITDARREEYLQDHPNGLFFTAPPIQLETDMYRGDDNGVFLWGKCVIPQPLLITKKFEDIESGEVKAELTFRDKGAWRTHTVPRAVIANRNKIIDLAGVGLMVTTDNANDIVNYLQHLQIENDIPTIRSVSHLGYFGKQFVPYDSELTYTGDTAYTDIYNAVHSKGEPKTWIDLYRNIRGDSLAARVCVTSSFASPLLSVFGKLPYFTHIWGDSGTGKSVCLLLASSVWGNPDGYMYTLNATSVGLERTAYFFHHLPLILDELQTVRGDDTSKLIYLLSQGQGRTRGTVKGVDTVLKWQNTFITSGEQPLTSSYSATGEINRIIDIPVSGQVFKNPTEVYQVCGANFGHAGRYFIEHIADLRPREILAAWETVLNEQNSEISGKHRMSMAMILCADELVNRILLHMDAVQARADTMKLYEGLKSVIISTRESDLTTRAYEFICGWITENHGNFYNVGDSSQPLPFLYWGKYCDGGATVEILGNALNETLTRAGFNYKAVLKGLADHNHIIKGNDGGNTKLIRGGGEGKAGRYVVLRM